MDKNTKLLLQQDEGITVEKGLERPEESGMVDASKGTSSSRYSRTVEHMSSL